VFFCAKAQGTRFTSTEPPKRLRPFRGIAKSTIPGSKNLSGFADR